MKMVSMKAQGRQKGAKTILTEISFIRGTRETDT